MDRLANIVAANIVRWTMWNVAAFMTDYDWCFKLLLCGYFHALLPKFAMPGDALTSIHML